MCMYFLTTDRPLIWENFEWWYLRNGSSDPLHVWFVKYFYYWTRRGSLIDATWVRASRVTRNFTRNSTRWTLKLLTEYIDSIPLTCSWWRYEPSQFASLLILYVEVNYQVSFLYDQNDILLVGTVSLSFKTYEACINADLQSLCVCTLCIWNWNAVILCSESCSETTW